MKSLVLVLCVLFSLSTVNSQTYEYLGLLKLPDSSLIPYKIDFKEVDGKISGYSFTDLNGKHETKATIVGRYDDKKNQLEFREIDIVYTKSTLKELDFCNVYFTGDMRRLNGKSKIEGTFKGYYDDLTSCIDGELFMSAAQKIQKRNEKLQKRVDRSSRVPDSVKQKFDLDKMFNRYAKNDLKGGEQLNIFWKEEYLKLIIWDDGEVDGDQIDLTINGNKILDAYSPVAKKKEMELSLIDPVNTISLKAVNLGVKPPNTAKIQLMKKNGEIIDLASNLQVGEEVTFVFYKEKPKVKK
ncbi:hypothetical protein LY01_02478 [Nonlabens xylanidelens]|uniref:Uncharacterized protein n=1 Tax=Nonlabens xylanidelens TaxID=191564 RepID=A0A2S6IHK4_9FLAO|nr:hypothetical protein [Nonlabens xylanidelens]PPK93694.1 hypothetical protein LY01_02478 [Nonlabens xylanidelens]PQJ17729.1 hypothetical protein BST94_11875 [Nonlabens xylanidelens]